LNDALLLAFASFAGLGRGSKSALRDVERALTSENVDPTTRYVCLQALWFADHLADQAERMIELSDQILDLGDDSPNLYYWRAYAFRRMGLYGEAKASIGGAGAAVRGCTEGCL